jgi:hypothetical protein
MRSKIGILLVLICLSSVYNGCVTARPEASVRPLNGDFAFVKAGETMTFAKNGAFCSDEYLKEVLWVKAKEAKK